MMEIEVNGNKYIICSDDIGNPTIKRYRSDYKLWVLVSFASEHNSDLDKKIQLILKDNYLNTQFKIQSKERVKNGR